MRPSSKIKSVCRQSWERMVGELVDILVEEDDDVEEPAKEGGRIGCEGRLAMNEVASFSCRLERMERSLQGLSAKSCKA